METPEFVTAQVSTNTVHVLKALERREINFETVFRMPYSNEFLWIRYTEVKFVRYMLKALEQRKNNFETVFRMPYSNEFLWIWYTEVKFVCLTALGILETYYLGPKCSATHKLAEYQSHVPLVTWYFSLYSEFGYQDDQSILIELSSWNQQFLLQPTKLI